jgi:S1-C subfamily serine protease
MNAFAAVLAVILLVAACGGGKGAPGNLAPMTLSYHPSEKIEALRFESYKAVVERAAPSYVRVIIRYKGSGQDSIDMAGGIVNGASGVIVDGSGLVVTAAHIALNTNHDAEVITMDGVRHPAQILRVERPRELALLRIAPYAGMQSASFADSDKLGRNEAVFAIGTPDNKGGVVSLGRVIDPKLSQRLDYNGFGFSDAIKMALAVKPGNSGGPVYDRQGRFLGIIGAFGLDNTENFDPKDPPLGYAVPANAVRAFAGVR